MREGISVGHTEQSGLMVCDMDAYCNEDRRNLDAAVDRQKDGMLLLVNKKME